MKFAIVIILTIVGLSSAANILGFFTIPAKSHHRTLYPIFEALAAKGHNVTVVTAYPKNERLENFREIDVSFTIDIHFDLAKKYFTRLPADTYFFEIIYNWLTIISDTLDKVIELDEIKDLLKGHFDAIIVENVTPLTYFMGIVNKAPIIGMSSVKGWINAHDALGNPLHPVLSPNFFLKSGDNPSFLERLTSTMYYVTYRLLYRYYEMPRSTKIARKHFGDDIPHLGDIERNMSLALFISNWVQNEIKPTVPSVVDINMIHIKPNKFLDGSPQGVIYFSMGTYGMTYTVTQQKMSIFKEVFASLPYRVIWKTDMIQEMPSNVLAKNWFPQNDILAHPNVKAFITQGGSHSIEEAIFNAIPLVVFPVVIDQEQNAKRIVHKGMGLNLDIMEVSNRTLRESIVEVAENKRYKKTALKLSKILKDQPMMGVEKAVWWVEYVIRHNGAHHLRSGFVDMPFYQYYLLDVMGFILLSTLLFIIGVYKLMNFFVNERIANKLKTQ
ncbi:unnamed protein product [Brassicogethes aeneus]|uniref:UDP-glucuronosyltransferase n=1 Tax=Brassicogethes aeneus TaxID=1431903 RepID=A0A9P0BGC8_BRAAE|nr:unnamed protein product [Brassicogethes aeneus]